MKSRQDLEAELVAQAMASDGFRQQLLSDPKTAIRQALNVEFPRNVKVVVHEETAETVHLVIPPSANGEMSDSQLDAIAGGAILTTTTTRPRGESSSGGGSSTTTNASTGSGGFSPVIPGPTGPIPIPWPNWA